MRKEFEYVPPTEETGSLHNAVRQARLEAHQRIMAAISEPRAPCVFQEVRSAASEFADVIEASAPPSADRSAALRCVRLAGMLANQAILVGEQESRSGAQPGVSFLRLAGMVQEQLLLARMQACVAIALGSSSR